MSKIKIAVAGVLAALCTTMALTAPQAQNPGRAAHQTQAAVVNNVVGNATALNVESRQLEFAQAHPGVAIKTWQGTSRIYGQSFGSGATPQAAAEAFRLNSLPTLGLPADEVQPYASFLPADHAGGNTVELMHDPVTGVPKFTAVYYTQVRDGVEVYGSRLTLLSRNVNNHPIVLAGIDLRELGGFHPNQAALNNINPAPSYATARKVLGDDVAILTAPRPVIWAGLDDMVVQPALALEFTAEGRNGFQGTSQIFRFITDLASGALLHQESLIYDINVSGNISGMATTGTGADVCGGIAATPMPYAKASIGATSVFADANGNFTIPNAGSTDVTVTADLTGLYFDARVCNGTQVPSPQGSPCGTPAPTSSQLVTPPGPANFMFNAPNTSELRRAEVNAYLHANVVRDYLLSYHPTFPTIAGETGFDVNINIGLNCNAFYSPSSQSINFYVAGGGCTNTSNSTVVHHEYGHRIVNAAGSGQGAYGEGFGDCMGVIVTDQSCLGEGFNQPCGAPSGCLRNANNTCQYQTSGCSSCGSEIHACGQRIAGSVWSTRNYLAATYPGTYRDIISSLLINSVLLHTGTSITPSITIDFLTLDDNDGNLANGTPHYNQINNGFTDHNMPGPPITAAIIITPTTGTTHQGIVGGPYTNNPYNYALENNTNVPANYTVSINGGGTAPLLLNGMSPPIGGTLAGHQIGNLAVSVAPAANSLPAGIYSSTVHIADTTNNVAYDVTHTLEIGQVGFTTTPANGLISGGPVGGPFTATQAYTLTSTKPTPVTVRAQAGANWISVNGGAGPVDVTLNGIGDSAMVTVGFSAAANSLPAGEVSSSVTFTNIGSGGSASDTSRPVSLDVGRFTYASTDTPIPICDLCQNIESSITVPDTYCVGDVDVQIDITHTYIGDLTVNVISPQGVVVRLHNRTGGTTDNIHKLYSDEGPNVPDGPGMLANFDNVSVAGVWKLRVSDHASQDVGSIDSWQLKVASAGSNCPPIANNVTVSVPVLVTSNITLNAVSSVGNLNYIITSLPSHGQLFDPNGGAIGSVPYTLLSMGNIVRYKPDSSYAGPDMFTYKANDGQDSNIANVNVTVGGPQLAVAFNMDTNPGWSTMGQWAWGQPTGGGSHNRDPSSGFTGPNVYGYNLAGDYPNSLTPIQYLTTGPINCANLTSVELRFQRWLGIESATFDHANIQVSNNGTTWTDVWNHTGVALNPTSWTALAYPIGSVADGQSTVYIRWGMGVTDISVTYPGWNIDDVQIWGIRPPCPADANGDGQVNVTDLLMVINSWGPCALCPADVAPPGGDGQVNVGDLLAVINGWGACP